MIPEKQEALDYAIGERERLLSLAKKARRDLNRLIAELPKMKSLENATLQLEDVGKALESAKRAESELARLDKEAG